MTADKSKLKTLNKLTDEGFDTEKKITSIDMKIAYDHGLSGEIGVILELQEAKQKLADDILSGEAVASASLSREELLELLG